MAIPPNITPPTGAWKTVKDLIADTVGPMALLGIAAGKFVSASAGAALNAQKMQQALASSEGANKILRQFETLTGSAAAARRQVEMLAKVASGGAFSFESLADASKNLQVLTNGALNTESALKKIQDAAAATGAPVDQMATAVADLYSSLENGSGVEQAADQLKQMGAISNQTAERLKSLSQAGVGLSTTWQVVEADLKKASGAANELASSITGLQQQLATIQQASDIKIGQMFEEGEKAGLRAAIGFQKFTAAVQEANSGPWAAFNAAINSVKESIGGLLGRFAETGAVKTIFQALAVVAIAVLIGVNAAIAGVVVQIGRWIAASTALRGAMAGLGGVVKGFAGFISLASLAASAAATAIIGIGVAALNAENNLRALIAKVKEFTSESDKSASASVAAANNIRSPEDQKNQEDNIDQQLKTLDEAKKDAQKTVTEGQEKSSGVWNTISSFGFNKLEGGGMVAGGTALIKDIDKRKLELLELKKKVSGTDAGPDNALFQKEEEQRKQEKEISDNARQRIQQGASPAMAKKMAEQQKVKTETELKAAMDSRDNVFKDQKILNTTSAEFSEGRDKLEAARSNYFSAKDANAPRIEAEIDRLAGGSDLRKRQTPEQIENLRNLAMENLSYDKTFANNQEVIKAGLPSENLAAFAAEGFDKARSGAKSESGKLQAERAKREALLQERQSAQEAGDLAKRQGDKVGAEDALRRQADVQQQIMQLSDPETGKQLGESALAPDQMRGLDSKINQALEAENDGKKRAADEAAGVELQATNEAAAADEASKEASERKLTIQKQLAALQGVEGGDGQAAQAELGPEIKQLQEKFNAVKALEAAENAYAEAKASGDKGKIAEAEGNLNQKKTAAARAGAQAGDTSGSIEQEKRGVEQILQIRQQQANIEKAAADARRNEIMQELRLRQQIAQLAFKNATGTTGQAGGKSEVDMRIEDEKKTRQKAEEAKALVAEREALRASGASPDAEQALNEKIAALGFDKNASSQDINAAIKKSQLNEADLRTQQVDANRDISRDARIQSFSAQEKYAPTQEGRMKAKQQREKLEDESTVEQKTAQYSKTMGEKDARKLAEKETELGRLQTRADEAGTPRVDSLTAVGGGATGFIGANPIDVQKEISKTTAELHSLLDSVDKKLQSQITQGSEVLQKLRE